MPTPLTFETITQEEAIHLGYAQITNTIDLCDAKFALSEARRFAAANIPHAIVQLEDGSLQVWRKLGAPLPTEHRRPQVRRSASRRPQDRRAQPPPPCLCASVVDPPSPPPELLAQALRLAATGNRYAPTKLRAFDTLVLTTAVQEWEPLGFRHDFLALINLELKRRRDAVAIGRSHILPAA